MTSRDRARSRPSRRHILHCGVVLAAAPALVPAPLAQGTGEMPDPALAPRSADLDALLELFAGRPEPRALVVAHHGREIAARGFNGFTPETRTNIKSASKSVISALVGIGIDRGVLPGVDMKIAEVLADDLPRDADPRLLDVTLGHLLSMRAGLERMSGPNYGTWVNSRNWVRAALAAPFVGRPGGEMLYSTASSHLAGAVLARMAERPLLDLARDWLGPVQGFEILGWDRDPQGLHMGGNQMSMTTRSLLAFGEVYRRGGLAADGTRIVSEGWIDASWTPYTRSRHSGMAYGYAWFLTAIGGTRAALAWGYGGQMLYVLPERALTIAITSDPMRPSARTGYRQTLDRLAGRIARAV